MCFSLAMFCVLDDKEFIVRVGTRKGQIGKWMYNTLWETYGTYYLNVRESTFIIFLLSKVLWFGIFFKLFVSLFTWLKKKNKNNEKNISYFVTRCTVSSDGSLNCCCWNGLLNNGGIVDEHHNKIKKSHTIETRIHGRKFLTFQFENKLCGHKIMMSSSPRLTPPPSGCIGVDCWPLKFFGY